MQGASPGMAMQPTQPGGLPDPNSSQLLNSPFGVSVQEAERIAKQILEAHRKGKENARHHALTAEKLLLHMTGEQWVDLIGGSRVGIPPNITGGMRLQDNILEVLVRHAVAYLTGQRYQFLAHSKNDRKSRDAARVDTRFANDIVRRQRLNQLIQETLFFAAPYGHCPVHAVWRDDLTADAYEPLYDIPTDQQAQMGELRRGYPDLYTGDPWDTVYNEGAKRNSVQWYSYGRVFPITLVDQTFGHVLQGKELRGSTRLASASRYQRILSKWNGLSGSDWHSSLLQSSSAGGDELVALVCREIAPGVLRQYPQGQLAIIAIDGVADTDKDSPSGQGGTPVLLHLGPLPGKRFSATRFYMSYAGDDVKGRPYLLDLDEDQVVYNQLYTLEFEWLKRFARPQWLISSGGLIDDTATTEDDALVEYAGSEPPKLAFPPSMQSPFRDPMQRRFEAMARKGGWQAASRGESSSGDAAAKVVALAKADDTIFAPIKQGIQDSLSELMGTCHALAKENMHVPQAITAIVGEDESYLAEPYISRDEMSDDPPFFELVSGFAPTPEHQVNQLAQLLQLGVIDQQEFRKLYPDQTVMPPELGAQHLRAARALRRNNVINGVAPQLEQVLAQAGPAGQQLMGQFFQQIMQEFPPELTDDPRLHIETLDQIVQDDDSHPVAKSIAREFQKMYQFRAMQQQMQAQAMGQDPNAQQKPGQPNAQQRPPNQQRPPRQIPGQRSPMQSKNTNRPPAQTESDVASLTRQAAAGSM